MPSRWRLRKYADGQMEAMLTCHKLAAMHEDTRTVSAKPKRSSTASLIDASYKIKRVRPKRGQSFGKRAEKAERQSKFFHSPAFAKLRRGIREGRMPDLSDL